LCMQRYTGRSKYGQNQGQAFKLAEHQIYPDNFQNGQRPKCYNNIGHILSGNVSQTDFYTKSCKIAPHCGKKPFETII
ncbi:hypothetical protein OFB72_32590, partial [Escherichia coli]|nr:hypothetical protein [Escherichia coli]